MLFKRLLSPAGIALLLACSTSTAFAHTPDQQPFLSINGENSKIYPVGSTSLTTLTLPQDLAPGTYLVNQPVTFSLLSVNLPIQAEYLSKTQFTWDFGDGSAYAIGTDITHTYAKIGSYTLSLRSSSQELGTPPQLLDLVLLNILPAADYQLPKAVVKANGLEATNPYTDILKLNLHAPLQLDSSASTAPAGIASRLWDLGDQHSDTQAATVHSYDPLLKYVLPMVRITDANGFFSDAFVQIEDDPSKPGFVAPDPPAAGPGAKSAKLPIGLAIGAVCIVVAFLRLRKRTRR